MILAVHSVIAHVYVVAVHSVVAHALVAVEPVAYEAGPAQL